MLKQLHIIVVSKADISPTQDIHRRAYATRNFTIHLTKAKSQDRILSNINPVLHSYLMFSWTQLKYHIYI